MAYELSRSLWDLVAWPGIKPGSLHSKHGVLTSGQSGKSLEPVLRWRRLWYMVWMFIYMFTWLLCFTCKRKKSQKIREVSKWNTLSQGALRESQGRFFFKKIILFICLKLCWVSLRNGLFSGCSKWGYSLVAVHRLLVAVASLVAKCSRTLSSYGRWASVVTAPRLWSTGSTAVAHGLSCPTAWGIFPNQGWNTCLLHWQADCLSLSHQEAARAGSNWVLSWLWF